MVAGAQRLHTDVSVPESIIADAMLAPFQSRSLITDVHTMPLSVTSLSVAGWSVPEAAHV